MLEMLTRITDDALRGEDGKRMQFASISDMYSKLYRDPVTSAYNRRYYDSKAQGAEKIYALAILDVDHFKDINNTYGRVVGDNVLMYIAKAISKELRKSDVLVRLGGDEFVMMFTSITSDIFEAKLKKICGDISTLSIDGMGEGRHISVSIGGTVGPDVPAVLMEKAGEMLIRAKKQQGTVEI